MSPKPSGNNLPGLDRVLRLTEAPVCQKSASLVRWALCMALVFCFNASHAATPQVAASGHTSMALDSGGNLYGWGDNGSGLLGRVDKAYGPTAIPAVTPLARGYSGLNRIYLIDTNAGLWGAGNNQFGQLGDGTFFLRRNALVKLGADYKDLAAGWYHTLAIKTDGSLWSWGSGDYGQLGDGLNAARSRPFPVPLGQAVSVAAGTLHSLAVLADGSLWAWGNNQFGQLGDGTNSDRTQPTRIGDGFVQVAAGDYFSLARKADGSVFAWGRNSEGQLGDASTTNRATPTAVAGRFSHIVASAAASLALDSVGSLYHWGRTLGISSSPMQLTPNRIALGIKGISAGEQHLLVQKLDGSLYAVGSNEYGELGVEDLAASESAILVKVANNPASFAAGGKQSLLIDANGKAYAWGNNSEGQDRKSVV